MPPTGHINIRYFFYRHFAPLGQFNWLYYWPHWGNSIGCITGAVRCQMSIANEENKYCAVGAIPNPIVISAPPYKPLSLSRLNRVYCSALQ